MPDGQMLLSDEQIVSLYWQRQEQAIAETDRKYSRYLYTIAGNILSDDYDREECLNDTYLGTWNAIPPQKSCSSKGFLTVIIRRICINRYHANRRKSVVPTEMTVALSELEGILTDDRSAENELESRALRVVLSDFIRSLPPRRQFIFMSRYYAAEPINTVAGELGLSRSMVNKELAAIRKQLRQTLEREGYVL